MTLTRSCVPQILGEFKGLLALVAIGLFLALVVPFVGVIVLCCRCCRRCGGAKNVAEKKGDTKWRGFLGLFLFFAVVAMLYVFRFFRPSSFGVSLSKQELSVCPFSRRHFLFTRFSPITLWLAYLEFKAIDPFQKCVPPSSCCTNYSIP